MDEHAIQKFWSCVAVDEDDACWFWQGPLEKRTGYGRFMSYGHVYAAHRFSYMLHHGEIPANMFVCHTCPAQKPGNLAWAKHARRCVNPAHLYLGNHKTNADDKIAHGYRNEHNRKLTDEDVQRILILYGTMQNKEIAALFGVNYRTISAIVRGQGWTHIPRALEDRGTKLTATHVKTILALQGFLPAKEIAARYGVTKEHVYNLWKGKYKKWSHLHA